MHLAFLAVQVNSLLPNRVNGVRPCDWALQVRDDIEHLLESYSVCAPAPLLGRGSCWPRGLLWNTTTLLVFSLTRSVRQGGWGREASPEEFSLLAPSTQSNPKPRPTGTVVLACTMWCSKLREFKKAMVLNLWVATSLVGVVVVQMTLSQSWPKTIGEHYITIYNRSKIIAVM